jgi:DNA-binding MarR family transcriptional regulator
MRDRGDRPRFCHTATVVTKGTVVRSRKKATGSSKPASETAETEFVGHFAFSILRAARVLRAYSDMGPNAQNTALAMIDTHGRLAISQLATLEGIARPTASALVGKLEGQGFVRRLDDPEDGRVCWIELTRSGRKHLRESRMRRTEWLLSQIQDCTPEEIRSLHVAARVLDQISEVPDEIGHTSRHP